MSLDLRLRQSSDDQKFGFEIFLVESRIPISIRVDFHRYSPQNVTTTPFDLQKYAIVKISTICQKSMQVFIDCPKFCMSKKYNLEKYYYHNFDIP